MTVSESLQQITNLTQQNFEILKVLNDSFYTKANHLTTQIGDVAYTIPSYIALENKVNHVQDAFNNLVQAAKAGEAWFNFDGNSKEIQVRGYQQAPNPVDLKPTNFFRTEPKSLFKDMLSPQPYLNFDLSTIPDDCNTVVVKKLIPYHADLKVALQMESEVESEGVATSLMEWSTVRKCLESHSPDYIPGTDYLEYESIYTLPLRRNIQVGTYVIESIVSDEINSDLENVLTIKVHKETPLTSWDQDGIVEKDLVAGDVLVTWDGTAKLKIISLQPAARTMKLLVMSGEYVNPLGVGELDMPKDKLLEYVSDYSKLRLYSSLTDDRYIHVPLEEDKYVYMAVAPINTRLNTRSEWGTGIFVNTDHLRLNDVDGDGFRTYYNENVRNIGDAITELSNILYPSITKYTEEEMKAMSAAPTLEDKTVQVVQINKHLNDSEAVRNIRALYSQKKQYQSDLSEIQSRISTLKDELLTISFDDMSGMRSSITAQITDLKTQQNNVITSISKITESIANSANNAEIPIEDAKFRIRGYVDVESFVDTVASIMDTDGDTDATVEALRGNILGVQCRYRYLNPDIPQANVSVIDGFLFTEWNLYNPPHRERAMKYKDGAYKVTYGDLNNGEFDKSRNENKFNQLDIPISQGEIVELQTRILWGYGYPFVTVTTDWSEPLQVSFPEELVKDVQVTTIISENNDDIEANRFENILREGGVAGHIEDKVEDQDITYFHKPESISSGFYTSERRIIPLKDKLMELSNNLTSVMDMLEGSYSSAIRVSLVYDNSEMELQPDITNTYQLPAYNSISEIEGEIPSGGAYKKDRVVYLTCNLKILNVSSHTVRLFPVIPGPRDKKISELTCPYTNNIWFGTFNGEGYPDGVELIFPSIDPESGQSMYTKPQGGNQVGLFCIRNPFNESGLDVCNYNDDHEKTGDVSTLNKGGLYYYPGSLSEYGLYLESDSWSAKLELAPQESFLFPILVEYKLDTAAGGGDTKSEDKKTFGFSLRNSLYTDPLYYECALVAKYTPTAADSVSSAIGSASGNGVRYNVTTR